MSPAIIASLTTLRDTGKLRWYAGMMGVNHRGSRCRIGEDGVVPTGFLPDTDDPVTAGVFLRMAQDAWGETAHLVRLPTHTQPAPGQDLEPALWWALAVGLSSVPFCHYADDPEYPNGRYLAGPTEIEALIAAILAAPEKKS